MSDKLRQICNFDFDIYQCGNNMGTYLQKRRKRKKDVHIQPQQSYRNGEIHTWLYLARRSLRQGAPVLIWPVESPTAKSAMKESSVSPLRCDAMTPQPAFFDILTASIDSVIVPI